MYRNKCVGVVVPAFNEAESVGVVVDKLFDTQLVDYVVVCDNASTDDTAAVARCAGAHVVYEGQKGYGAACLRALSDMPVATDVVVFVDADDSVEASELESLLQRWYAGADLVIGSRSLGEMAPGALSPQQRWGNRFASFLMRTIWRQPVTDLGPFRAIDVAALNRVKMCDRAFGWTVEMQVKALSAGMSIEEVPVTTRARIGESKIGGTLRGTIGATFGILGTIAKHAWAVHRAPKLRWTPRVAGWGSEPELATVTATVPVVQHKR